MNARTVACVAAVITGLAIVYTVALLLGMPDPDWAYLGRGVIHLGELATFVALGLSGAAGTACWASSGSASACSARCCSPSPK